LSILIPAAQQQTSEETPKKEDSFEAELCKDKDAGEWFRLVAGEGDNCRDVIQCTSSVSHQHGGVVGINVRSIRNLAGRYLILRVNQQNNRVT